MKKTRIKPISEKQRKINIELRRIKQDLLDSSPRCFFCGKYGDINSLDQVHIVRRSYCECLTTERKNLILGCRTCHTIFDSSDRDEIMKLKNIETVLDRMMLMDVLYCNRFIQKK